MLGRGRHDGHFVCSRVCLAPVEGDDLSCRNAPFDKNTVNPFRNHKQLGFIHDRLNRGFIAVVIMIVGNDDHINGAEGFRV